MGEPPKTCRAQRTQRTQCVLRYTAHETNKAINQYTSVSRVSSLFFSILRMFASGHSSQLRAAYKRPDDHPDIGRLKHTKRESLRTETAVLMYIAHRQAVLIDLINVLPRLPRPYQLPLTSFSLSDIAPCACYVLACFQCVLTHTQTRTRWPKLLVCGAKSRH